ncbi:MAG: 2-iminoacetate synthase ThiH [Flavobacteriales bacterium]|nr:2-iminoacetate synthase ThiH [Flavobacteriales bacterium]
MRSFTNIFSNVDWEAATASIYSKTHQDVETALSKSARNLEDFKALISPAAGPYLEQMAQLSHQLTQKRFGKTIQLFVPMYLSNECQNICTYCGFSLDVDILRKTLDDKEILAEVAIIKAMGFDHILLVTGEANKTVGIEYFQHALELIRPHFSHISLEVQPLDEEDYALLTPFGLNTVLVYQETYHEKEYKTHHPKGKKSNFQYRLETPDRLGRAGVHKIGLGALIGLEDWRTDSFFTALHLDYLERTYWQTKYSISFPRLRPCAGGIDLKSNMSEKELVQLICAYRIFNEEVELSLSTRESESFRNNAVKLGITTMSAGSKTNPGGYANTESSLEQFSIDDNRTPHEISSMITSNGYEPIWKDWDQVLQCEPA